MCVVYLIVLRTIQSNFLKILKDTNWISPTTGCALGSNASLSDPLIPTDQRSVDTRIGHYNPAWEESRGDEVILKMEIHS